MTGIQVTMTANGGARERSPHRHLLLYAQHGRHLYGESPEWGLASAYH